MAGTAERTLALKLIGDVRGLKPAQRGLGSFTKSVVSWGKALSGALVIGGIERVVGSLGDANKAFREEQDIIRSFNRTVKNLRLPIKATTASMDEMADRAINLGFDDAETIRGLNQFLKLTGDIKDANALMALSFDIARSRGIDHAAAMKIAEGVYRGSARSLKLYGLEGVKGMEAVSKAAAKEKDQAREWARNHPLAVGIGRISDAWADLVGNFVSGDFKGVSKAFGKLGEAVQDALFGGKGSDNIRNSKKAGLVNQFGAWASELAKSIGKAITDTDWNQVFTDVLTGIKAFIDSGAAGTLATVAGALALGLFAVDAAVTALTALFSVPKLLVKGVVSAIKTVGVAIAATMFGSQKVAEAAGNAMAATITTAADGKVVGGAAARAGLGIGGLIAAGIGSLIAGAIVGGLTLATQEANRLPIALLASAKQARGRGARDKDTVAAQLRRSFPQATDAQIEDALKGAGFARGTSSAPRGWHWVGEKGPELMRFRGGEQVVPNRQSMAMAGGSAYSISVYVAPGGDLVDAGRQMVRAIREYEKRGGASWRN